MTTARKPKAATTRRRVPAKKKQPPTTPWTLEQAGQLVADGYSVEHATRRTGFSEHQIRWVCSRLER